MTKIEWAEPPAAKTGRRGVINELGPELKAEPGRWARVETATYSSRPHAWRKKGFEAVARKNADGTYDVYARWPETVERIGRCTACGKTVKVDEHGRCRYHRVAA